MKPQTAQQINDPQTGQVSTSRHSALSELMVQNVELRAEVERIKADTHLCAEHGHPACPVCVEDFRKTESELGAWHSQFGAQLSHAVEERDRLKEQLRLIQLANGDLDASNRKLREQLAVLQSAYDSLSQMKEKQVASRIETDELRGDNEALKAENARLAAAILNLDKLNSYCGSWSDIAPIVAEAVALARRAGERKP